MKASHLFGITLRESPAEAETASHRLLLRAGYLRPLTTGIFSMLPLAWRSQRKIEQILREEIDAIGGQELSMPVVHPAEVWQVSGRWSDIGAAMVRFKDRRGADMLLAMTHEEVVARLASSELRSYRQLPQLVYQIQTKFRDEPRARAGLIRVREFTMKDSYSLDLDVAGLEKQYKAHYDAYFRIFLRCGLPVVAVASDTGMMGGRVAHEFMYVTPIGEDTLVLCDACGYAANLEVARMRKDAAPDEAPRGSRRVHTPNAKTIADVAGFLGVATTGVGKAVFFVGRFGGDKPDRLILAMVRGDHEVNPVPVMAAVKALELRPAHDEEIRAAGIVPGFGSPVGVDHALVSVVVDDLLTVASNLVVGGNEADHHLADARYGVDFSADHVADIALVPHGAPCARCGEPLRHGRGVEVGNIFQLGTKYTAAAGANYIDEAGAEVPIIMGSYGIGVGRLLACAAEAHNDAQGLALPISIAPFEVSLVSLGRNPKTAELAEELYRKLLAAGVEVLFDDRNMSAGAKLADSDLRGIPLRVVVSDRGVERGQVEIKRRSSGEQSMAPLEGAVEAVKAALDALRAELAATLDHAPRWE